MDHGFRVMTTLGCPQRCVCLQAELRETKCSIVVGKVKLATLIYPDTCRNDQLQLFCLSPRRHLGGKTKTRRMLSGYRKVMSEPMNVRPDSYLLTRMIDPR